MAAVAILATYQNKDITNTQQRKTDPTKDKFSK